MTLSVRKLGEWIKAKELAEQLRREQESLRDPHAQGQPAVGCAAG